MTYPTKRQIKSDYLSDRLTMIEATHLLMEGFDMFMGEALAYLQS